MRMAQGQQTFEESVAPLAADFEAIGRRVRGQTLKAVAMHFSGLALPSDILQRETQNGAGQGTTRNDRDGS